MFTESFLAHCLKNNCYFNNGIVKFLNDRGAEELNRDLQKLAEKYVLPSYSVSINYYEIKQEYITGLIIKTLILVMGIILGRKIWKVVCKSENVI